MNRALTMEDLRGRLALHSTPLEGIVDTDYEWNLGQLSIHKRLPEFRIGYGDHLGPDSKLYKFPFEFGTTQRGVAVVFQAFAIDSQLTDHPEYVIGWVPTERENELEYWIEFLNAEIAMRVTGSSLSSDPAAAGGQPIEVAVFKEFGWDDVPTARSLAEVRGKRAADHKADVVAYLLSGRTIAYYMGIDADVFDESKLADTRSAMTDGTYSWPRLLAYYVENYDVALPQEFEDHMRKNNWRVPNEA